MTSLIDRRPHRIAGVRKVAFVELHRYEWYVAAALFLADLSLLIGHLLLRYRSQREELR